MKFYQQYTLAEKKKLRAQLGEIRRMRKEQAAELEKAFILPLKECEHACESVLKNEMSIEAFLKKNEAAQKRLAWLTREIK